MNNTHKLTTLALLTLIALNGCESKTENNIQASKTLQDIRNIEITHNTNIKTKEENYKTATYYNTHKEERERKIKECNESYSSSRKKDIECDNAKRARQLEKRKNSSGFNHQSFL